MNEGTRSSETLQVVRYEIRRQLVRRVCKLEKRDYEIISLNNGNAGLFGCRTPETMRLSDVRLVN